MPSKVKVTLDTGKQIEVEKGTTLFEILNNNEVGRKYPVVGAMVNNVICDLWEEIEEDSRVIFIDRSHRDGCLMLTRGFTMVMVKSVNEIYPDRELKVLHSLSRGLFCRWSDGSPMKKIEVETIEKRMRELIEEDIKFVRKEITREEGKRIFSEAGMWDKVNLIQFRRKKTMKVYTCGGYTSYFFGRLPPSTGALGEFELRYYPPGLILRFPCKTHPQGIPPYVEQRKLASIYNEYKQWAEIMGVSDVASLNNIITNGEINDLIRVMEALHEKKIARIADLITRDIENLKIILIAGPSCSGKTTFTQRLMVQLRVNGLKPVALSLDDYFVDKEKTPRDEDGNLDFEHIEAIDIPLFNDHLQRLLYNEEVMVPRFDFKVGKRVENHKRLKLTEKNILIVEGIHGLNPLLTESIPNENKYKIYVSALTMLNLDNHNRIPTTDTRIIRRIVRDSQFRNHTALETIYMWPLVRRGEERFIFPFQEEADVMFNSALIYELAALKSFVEPLLREIPRSEPAFAEAKRLLSFTDNFLEIGTDEIPPNSILREFIGATCFFKMDIV